MKKRLLALLAAVTITLSLTGCDALNSMFNKSDDNSSDIPSDISSSTSDNIPSSTNSSTSSTSGNSGSGSNSSAISTTPLTVRCGDIIIENDKRTFDVETTCGNAFAVIFHYISTENRRIENAVPSFRPLGVTSLKAILNDPIVGGGDLSESDFELSGGVYKMKDEEKAKSLLGSLATTYSFDEYWKNQKMAELVSTEGISAEEARPKVEELFEKMENNV